MPAKLYLETTIVSYFVARPSRDLITAAHQQITQEWWEMRRDEFEVFISQLVLQEASAGDAQVVQRRLQALQNLPVLDMIETVTDLAQALLAANALPRKALGDAFHVALSAVYGMDYLLTWNMKHIANASMRRMITVICQRHGYNAPIICTPEELLEA